MSLSTLTIDTLTERNQRAFERAKLQPDMNVDALRGRQRQRLERLLSDRSHINDLASTEDQKILYGGEAGAEVWHRDFVLLRTIEKDANIRLEGEKLRRHIWNKVPNSRFKRFQELFSRPEQLSVPRFTSSATGRVNFCDIDFNTESLLGCLVSADRIPEQLAEDLKLCDFSEDKGDPIARLKKKREKIPALKKLFESAKPLQEGHHRLLEIATPDATVDAMYPDIQGPDPSILGTILYSRERENSAPQQKRREPPAPRTLSVQHFTSVYGAYRKTEHEQEVYRQELESLTELREDLRTLNGTLDRDWRKNTEEPRKVELRSEALTLISKGTEALRTCENRYKVHAHDLLQGSETLTDKSGKQNVSVVMTKMVAAIEALKKRLREMYPKGGFNYEDQMVLHSVITAQQKNLKDFRTEFAHGAKHLDDKLALFDPNAKLAETQLHANIRGVESRMGSAKMLASISLQPLRTYAKRLEIEWSILHAKLESRDRNGAIDQAIKIHVIGKIQAACTCFEHIKGFTGNALRIPLSQIGEFVGALRILFDKRELFPERSVASYANSFALIRETITLLESEMDKYKDGNLEISQRTALYQKLRKTINMLDLDAIIATLP